MDAESVVWSSGESEPNESDDERNMIGASEDINTNVPCDIDKEYPDIFYDSSFYPSVKDFTGLSDILVQGDTPLDYFEIFFNSTLLEIITMQTNLYQEQNPEPLRSKM